MGDQEQYEGFEHGGVRHFRDWKRDGGARWLCYVMMDRLNVFRGVFCVVDDFGNLVRVPS